MVFAAYGAAMGWSFEGTTLFPEELGAAVVEAEANDDYGGIVT